MLGVLFERSMFRTFTFINDSERPECSRYEKWILFKPCNDNHSMLLDESKRAEALRFIPVSMKNTSLMRL